MNSIWTSARGLAKLVARVFHRARDRRRAGLAAALGLAVVLSTGTGCSAQPSFSDQLMAKMDELPSVQALKTHYPGDYASLRSKIGGLSAQSNPSEIQGLVASVFAGVLQRQIAKADAESAHALHQVTRTYAAALREVDPRGCYDMLDGKAAPPTLEKVRSASAEQQDMEATRRFLVQTATDPAAPATPLPFDELLEKASAAVATLPDKDQDIAITILREERDPRTHEESAIMCAFNLALADQFLALPPRIGGAKIRALWAME